MGSQTSFGQKQNKSHGHRSGKPIEENDQGVHRNTSSSNCCSGWNIGPHRLPAPKEKCQKKCRLSYCRTNRQFEARYRQHINICVQNKALDGVAFYESIPLFGKDQWQNNKHLFISSLDRESIRSIDKFYSLAHIINKQQDLITNLQNNHFFLVQNHLPMSNPVSFSGLP